MKFIDQLSRIILMFDLDIIPFVIFDQNQSFRFSYTRLPKFDLTIPIVVVFRLPLMLNDTVTYSVTYLYSNYLRISRCIT